MKEESITTESNSILIPALISGVVSAGVALLLTPKSGKEMRANLSKFARRTGEESPDVPEESELAVTSGSASYGTPAAQAQESLSEWTEPEEGRSILVPVLVSGVIGAAIALLFAPKPGSEMMEDIKGAASTAIEKGKDLYQQGAAAVKEAMEKGKEAAGEGAEKLRPAA